MPTKHTYGSTGNITLYGRLTVLAYGGITVYHTIGKH